MPKGISLKVRRDPARKCPWYVNIPASLSATGRRQRLFFETRELAAGEVERLKTRRDNFGVSLGNLTSTQIIEAADCYETLTAYPDVSLTEAVRGYLEVLKTRSGSIPFGELFNRFLEAKREKSPPYLQALRWARSVFNPLAERLACDVTVRDLEAVLAPLKPSVRDAHRRYIRAVLNFGLRLDFLPANPAVKLEPCKPVKGETEIFTPEQVRQLLECALRDDLAFLPYRVLAFFCGIRPTGELTRLDWRHVSIPERLVTLPAAITKTKHKRFVDLSENAIAWLSAYGERGGTFHGLVAPFSSEALNKHHQANYRLAGINRWVKQVARHSFCSYWLPVHGNDVDKLVILSGHTDKTVLWRHYYKATTKHEALKFWSIAPESS